MTGDELYVMNTATGERVKAKPDKNPLSNLKSTMLFHVRGWDSNFRDAWMLGMTIVSRKCVIGGSGQMKMQICLESCMNNMRNCLKSAIRKLHCLEIKDEGTDEDARTD